MGVPIRFPIQTARLTIRPMQLDDAEALLAVYGDVETMQHLNSELPATVAEAREWVQTKIDLFDQDNQFSLWTVIHNESAQIMGDEACSTRTTAGVQWSDSGEEAMDSSGVKGSALRQPAPPSLSDSRSWASPPSAQKTRPRFPGSVIARQTRYAAGRKQHRRMAGLHDHSRRVVPDLSGPH